jgi:hypothetical protein
MKYKKYPKLFLLSLLISLILSTTSCSMTDALNLVKPSSGIQAEVNVGDNRKEMSIGDKATAIDEMGDNNTVNTSTKHQEKSLDINQARTVTQNNSLDWWVWILLGLLISLDALIASVKSIFTGIKL